ncbi:hypothetical protein [Actinomyces howellii]|uniref:Uncharacterized protein n=1 Tax=Actinomyces howellii TaxID=52771 RepID=A0A3S4TBC7_9ACTO|nr:hypothetical protein [Actinomyces howellii]VEG29998.1 Uncharacterised protein [Actinomyces howellii]
MTSQHDEVTAQASGEARRAFQVAVQVARFLADQRARSLERARRRSLAQERAVRDTIERQRRLAEPVLRRGMDDRFWDAAQPKDAAYVHGVAVRFEQVDPLARMVVDRCRDEARRRWDVDLDDTTTTRAEDLDGAVAADVAPILEDEEDVDLRTALDQTAEQQETHQGRTKEPAKEQPHGQGPTADDARRTDPPAVGHETADGTVEETGASTVTASELSADENTAWRWFTSHYDPTRTMPDQDDAHRRAWAHSTWAAMAAEGIDLDHPPAIEPLTGDARDSWRSQDGASAQVADALGVDPAHVRGRVDPRSLSPLRRSWEIEQAGAWPELSQWDQTFQTSGSAALRSGYEPRLVGQAPTPGRYTALTRQAAAAEARQAGMDVGTYLDHLQPLQRRGLISTHTSGAGKEGTETHDQLALAASYRVAYARRSALERPDWSIRRARAADRATSFQDGSSRQPAWDSTQARQAWAETQLARGVDPEAVRAVATGDRALHEPASRATAHQSTTAKNGAADRPRVTAKQALHGQDQQM